MAKTFIIALVFGIIILSSVTFASTCAAKAYQNSCSACPFDANGKMNQSCYEGYQSSGVSCFGTSHPIAMTQFTQGKCPQVQECVDELNTCKTQYSSGNDSADCQEGSVAICFAATDSCVDQASSECGEKLPTCPTSAVVLGLVLVGAAFVSSRKRMK